MTDQFPRVSKERIAEIDYRIKNSNMLNAISMEPQVMRDLLADHADMEAALAEAHTDRIQELHGLRNALSDAKAEIKRLRVWGKSQIIENTRLRKCETALRELLRRALHASDESYIWPLEMCAAHEALGEQPALSSALRSFQSQSNELTDLRAQLAAAKKRVRDEREECAKIALGEKVGVSDETDISYNRACDHIASALRARSTNGGEG